MNDFDFDKSTLGTFGEYRPTMFDVPGKGSNGKEHWLVGPCIRTRDSDALERSNYDEMIELIENEIGDEEDTWETHSFNHWGPGWFSIVVVQPNTLAHKVVVECEYALADYPVLCEERMSRYEEDDKD
jgi:hypothetical protein